MKAIKTDETDNNLMKQKSALFGDDTGKIKTFAVLNSENSMSMDAESKNAHRAAQELKRALKIMGLGYMPIRDDYGNKETSFVIFNCSLSDAKVLAKAYKQEHFFWGRSNSDFGSNIGHYRTKNKGITYSLTEMSDVTYEEEAADFFAQFDIKLHVNMREFADDVPVIENTAEFEESLNENRTVMSRVLHRRDAFRI